MAVAHTNPRLCQALGHSRGPESGKIEAHGEHALGYQRRVAYHVNRSAVTLLLTAL